MACITIKVGIVGKDAGSVGESILAVKVSPTLVVLGAHSYVGTLTYGTGGAGGERVGTNGVAPS